MIKNYEKLFNIAKRIILPTAILWFLVSSFTTIDVIGHCYDGKYSLSDGCLSSYSSSSYGMHLMQNLGTVIWVVIQNALMMFIGLSIAYLPLAIYEKLCEIKDK